MKRSIKLEEDKKKAIAQTIGGLWLAKQEGRFIEKTIVINLPFKPNPIHNAELLITHREEMYQAELEKERTLWKLYNKELSAEKVMPFRQTWVEKEKLILSNWMKRANSAVRDELNKYLIHLNNSILVSEVLVNESEDCVQVAFRYCVEGKAMTEDNWREVAKANGWTSNKVFQYYKSFKRGKWITAKQGLTAAQNRVNSFEAVRKGYHQYSDPYRRASTAITSIRTTMLKIQEETEENKNPVPNPV